MMELFYEEEIHDKDGNLVHQARGKSESFVAQYNILIYIHFGNLLTINVVDTGGTTRQIDRSAGNFKMDAAANDDTTGIVVGSGATAVDIEDYALETQIADGVGAGQLDHGAVSFPNTPAKSGSTYSFTTRRLFTNSSGDTVSYQEYGIYCEMYDAAVKYKGMIIRDVKSSAVNIPNGQTLTITYTIKITA